MRQGNVFRSAGWQSSYLYRLSLLLVLWTLLSTLSGCTPERSYFEPEVMPEERIKSALVRTPSPIYRDGKDLIFIKTIDGQKPTFHQDKAIVAPGLHVFQVALEFHHPDTRNPDKSYSTKADVSLRFEVEAEGEYLIDGIENEDGIWLWAKDLKTDITVAGRRPQNLPEGQKVEPLWAE